MSGPQLDPRSWLVWALAASLPALLGRNPFPLLVCLLAGIAVRQHWQRQARLAAAWSGLFKLAVVFSLIGVVFNALTVGAGDVVLFSIPEEIPLIGGDVTANAVIFGLLSGLAVLILVTVGMTIASLIDWAAALRLVPQQFMSLAVAGSVALTFLPQTVVAYREIREAQATRGHRIRGVRDASMLFAPLLSGGLERALTLAEALESRAFGAPPIGMAQSRRRVQEVASVLGLGFAVIGAYGVALGRAAFGGPFLVFGAIMIGMAARESGAAQWPRTRYRAARLGSRDWLVIGGAALALVTVLTALMVDSDSLRYEPYPTLEMPAPNFWLMLGMAGLFAPALIDTDQTTRML
jgi:energy-coupling factor transport system permease protein